MGLLLPRVVEQLQQFPDVFCMKSSEHGDIEAVELQSDFKTFEARSEAVSKVVNTWRSNDAFCALRGWRDEVTFNDPRNR